MKSRISHDNNYRYKLLQTAVNKFGQAYASLTSEQQHEVDCLTGKQLELQGAILASEEAKQLLIARGRVDAAVADIIARYPSKADFKTELEANLLSMASFRQSVHLELLVEAVFEVVANQVAEVSDTNARLYYYFHPEKFKRLETRSARHILLTINPDFPENTREQAFARLVLIARHLKKSPQRFAEQATKYSECPTAMDGGYLGRIAPAKLFPALDKELFSLAEGEVSDVVESELGFHILLCEAVHPTEIIPVDDVVDTIIEKLTQQRQKRHQQKWLRSLLLRNQHNRHQRQGERHTSNAPKSASKHYPRVGLAANSKVSLSQAEILARL